MGILAKKAQNGIMTTPTKKSQFTGVQWFEDPDKINTSFDLSAAGLKTYPKGMDIYNVDEKVGKSGYTSMMPVNANSKYATLVKNDMPVQMGDTLLNPGMHNLTINPVKAGQIRVATPTGSKGNLKIVNLFLGKQ